MTINWTEIENKWRTKWQENKDFETNPNDKPKKFITVAYPYPNSPQHIGHGRTYTLADVHARFYRMKGYNVLFPMGFHYTGTPVLGMAKRIEAGEKEILDGLRNIYHVPEDAIKTFVEPIKIADYFHEEIKSGMIEMGYSIDWRREFTTIVPGYQRFIEWQITTLKEKGRIIQGSHPVGWCPVDQNPVSQHDTMGDVEPKIDDKNFLIKFKFGEFVFPITTLRPETIFGITNLWVNPKTIYKKVSVDGETWIVSSECAKKISFFEKEVSEIGEIPGSEIIGKTAINHDGRKIPILPADFVEPSMGTGLVMSVPAHAPKDYQALVDFKKDQPQSSEYQLIKPISIIATEGYSEIPAKDIIEKMGISDQSDDKLEEATKELYLKEFTDGKLNGKCDQFDGEKVQFGRDKIRAWLQENGNLEKFPVLENAPVRCRCGAECVVKVLNNQWFLNYGDEEWKELARNCLDEMNILPNNIKTEFVEVIDWLHERACARQQGLGTKLPWDKDWIVESLSDSVIYMAYYTLSRFVNDGTVSPENLTKEFFDYVLSDKGDVSLAASTSKLSEDTINLMKKEFTYFYPVDSRHSGRDLVQNHLSFFVLNHVAIFEKNLWPQEIVVNGSVMMDGAKMSKSMGNIIPLRAAIKDHGADPIRLAIISSAELLQDADFNMESVSGIQSKLESLLEACSSLKKAEIGELQAEDRWILSKTQSKIAEITEAVEKMRLREALHDILFTFESDLSWYSKRTQAKGREDISGILHQINSARVAMLSPFAPHVSEEMWERLGNSELVSKSQWPEYSADKVDAASIQAEELLKSTMDDITNILKVTKIEPKKIVIYVNSDETKSRIYRKMLSIMVGGQNNMGVVMKELIADPNTADAKKMPDFVQKVIKDLHSESESIKKMKLEAESFDEKEFLKSELYSMGKKEFGVDIEVYSESDENIYDPKGKARHARPFKPAILIE
ncbi:Leucine--tRNA ligase protein [Marine Group I thaumarchaeote SCGC AAA799-E16]|uniref:Leucine--tRNA ligase n=4 Tax=Marine Group I TaxID=905826 RepID=A0A081RM17_9ARCH|nr:Leucine--tRNA ligase protein [Marine Group I thaumarchaeote SCGC AAA799-N04]KER06353.1 Leucine--tRNA ligase protein [Marine Group I thaumarchaeote SCGC AAA799-E16]KFM17233.1 Leucine--tRNA ligase protein [Marine Group I thaumarchaeote SCGC AAA799-D11]KFM19090.1 Leucine--tRNA ligase protein [Marine Group I thaumarchaeote SCGC RSA3]